MPFLGRHTHRLTSLILAECVACHCHASASSSSKASILIPNVVSDSVQLLSNMILRSWNSVQLGQWAWHLAHKLRLHLLDAYPRHQAAVLGDPARAFQLVPDIDADPSLAILRRGITARETLSCYVALSASSLGHSVPILCARGIPILADLAHQVRHHRLLFEKKNSP